MKIRTLAAASAIAALSMTGQALAADMKITHVVPDGAPRDRGADLMAEMINADDRCDLDAKVFPGGQLGGTEILIENLQLGALEVAILPASFLVGFQPLVGIMDFPFFWPTDREALEQIHRSEAMRALLDTTEDKGIHTLGVWHTGFKTWTANKPLVDKADYAGVKARVMPSSVLVRQDEILGMTPIGMPFSETYTALQTKAIDAQENPITTSFFMKFHEVQDYMTLTNHGTLDQLVMTSKSWFEALSPECQTAVNEANAAGAKLTADLTYSIIEKAKEAFTASGMQIVEISDENFNALRDDVLPGIEAFYVEENGDEAAAILAGFKKELGM